MDEEDISRELRAKPLFKASSTIPKDNSRGFIFQDLELGILFEMFYEAIERITEAKKAIL